MAEFPVTTSGRKVIHHIWLQILWQTCFLVLAAAVLGIAVNYVRPDRLSFTKTSYETDPASLDIIDDMAICLDEAKAIFFSSAAIFLDSRAPESYLQEHIPGALNLPWETWQENLDAVMSGISSQDALIIIYSDEEFCDSSIHLAFFLKGLGYENVWYLETGWSEWKKNGLPTEGNGISPHS